MTVTELLNVVQFVVDQTGERKAVLLDLAVWEALIETLEDQEDAAELEELREADEETISWEEAKANLRGVF